MKKFSFISVFLLVFAFGKMAQGNAAIVTVGAPGVVFSSGQPIQAVVVDSAGNNFQQTIYYDPAIGGVDLDTNWAGPNASVYFPTLGTGYVWYNGYWVDQAGYYWNGGRRVYVGHPHWGNFWVGYWHGRDHWHGHGHPEVSYHIHEKVKVYGGHHHH